ncbi:class I SAM-dependent methyltransferase [Phreatobacter sp. AB_2022a]|uniref:class I SAM-dependent methyltransferase n=1 Tax=Phreatobacter sp. AB_2022a TaxID=3003134 RepID=UPI002286DDE0|nr:methyltransferase [Phreatobacter sp. AB_2022a]MCZ0736859.1 methyltransferase [Phreatobacter sp. AB_2022a]
MIADRSAFIRANTRLLAVPHAPEISLHLADEATELWQKTEDELGAIGLDPPFWAFAWAGGQALARYVLDQPGLVAGRTVLDVATGSGLVAIAAAKAGAARVTAVDIDAFAEVAVRLNAAANGVAVTAETADPTGTDAGWEVILAGDICYQRDMTEAMLGWLGPLAAAGRTVLLGDPGRTYLPRGRLEKLAEYQVPVTRALEDLEIKRTGVWRVVG